MAMSIEDKYQDEVEKLLEVGKEKEFLSYDDINELLPPDVNSADDIEALFEKISAEGISIGDSDEKFLSPESEKKLDEPVDEEVVADQQGVFHRAAGNVVGLNHEGVRELQEDGGDDQRLQVFPRDMPVLSHAA